MFPPESLTSGSPGEGVITGGTGNDGDRELEPYEAPGPDEGDDDLLFAFGNDVEMPSVSGVWEIELSQ